MGGRQALLIGVDGYSFRPLASAVNDAVAMRDALTDPARSLPPLFDRTEVTLLATPAQPVPAGPPNELATRDNIMGALKECYDSEDPLDFLLVFFAGHGLMASPDGRTRDTLILPSDVRGTDDGRQMICLTELLRIFSERGPTEQLWIIDACRDMPFQKRPRGYEIDWPEQPIQTQRAQFALFAVAPGGTALSEAGGQGRLTTHLLNGLTGQGAAADFIPGLGHCVTAPSLHEYAALRVKEAVADYDDYTRAVQVPQRYQNGPLLAPLRRLPRPERRPFSVNVIPPEAKTAIKIELELQQGTPVNGWPPSAPPQVYELRASLLPNMSEQGWGTPLPELRAVDLREQNSAIVEVPRQQGPGSIPSAVATVGAQGVAAAQTVSQTLPQPTFGGPGGPEAALGATVTVRSVDNAAHVQLRRAEMPWTELTGHVGAPISVAPGTWDVSVLVGDTPSSRARIVLSAGEERTIDALAQLTPTAAALLPPDLAQDSTPTAVMPSESIGPMQGVILPTLLPLLGLKLFDSSGKVLSRFGHLGLPTIATMPGHTPFVVALALEGTQSDETCSVSDAQEMWTGPEAKVRLFVGETRQARGTLDIRIAGRCVSIACPSIEGGATVVTVTCWPDGRLDYSVGIFRLPIGEVWPGQGEGGTAPKEWAMPAGRLSRALSLAAPLFRAGAALEFAQDSLLSDIAHAKWLDPVLGALSFHAYDHRIAALKENAPEAAHPAYMRAIIRRNLGKFFGALPDSRIISALHEDPGERRAALVELLERDDLGEPVLAASCAHLARAASETDRAEHPSVARFDSISAGEIFNAVHASQQ